MGREAKLKKTIGKLDKGISEISPYTLPIISRGGCLVVPAYALLTIFEGMGLEERLEQEAIKQNKTLKDMHDEREGENPGLSAYVYFRDGIKCALTNSVLPNEILDEIFPFTAVVTMSGTVTHYTPIERIPESLIDWDKFESGDLAVAVKREDSSAFETVIKAHGYSDIIFAEEEGDYMLYSNFVDGHVFMSPLSEDALNASPLVYNEAVLIEYSGGVV